MTCNIQDIGTILKIKFGYLVLPPSEPTTAPATPSSRAHRQARPSLPKLAGPAEQMASEVVKPCYSTKVINHAPILSRAIVQR